MWKLRNKDINDPFKVKQKWIAQPELSLSSPAFYLPGTFFLSGKNNWEICKNWKYDLINQDFSEDLGHVIIIIVTYDSLL